MPEDPEYKPAPIPPVSVPVPAVSARSDAVPRVEPRTEPPTEPRDAPPVQPAQLEYVPGLYSDYPDRTPAATLVAITLLSILLAILTLLGMLGTAFAGLMDSGPTYLARDGWTPARGQLAEFPIFGSPLVTIVVIVGAVCTRRSSGWWLLWFGFGFALVIAFIAVGAYSLDGAPATE